MRERVNKCPFLHSVTISLKNIKERKEKKSHSSKVGNKTIWVFHQGMHTSFKTSNFQLQGLQTAALQQRYSPR